MSQEAYASALKNALNEIQNVCPNVQTAFLFDKDATLVAGNLETPETTPRRVVESLRGVLGKADTLGGFESLTVEGSKGNVHISCINGMYLTIVASKDADICYVETVGRVLIPTVMKLLDSLGPTPLRLRSPTSLPKLAARENPKVEDEDDEEKDSESHYEAGVGKVGASDSDESEHLLLSELPTNQLIVESFGGLLVRSDTVQISGEIISQWQERLEGKKIEHVEIESFNGLTSQCKVKVLNDSKFENKAVIRIPEKLCQTLDIKKGELVRVKPLPS